MQPNLENLFQEALVWDAHAGVFPSPEVDLNLLQEWLDYGVNYLSINVGFDVMNWQDTLATLAAYRHWMLAHPDRFVLVNDAADIDRARKESKFALSFDIEGMNALNQDINMVGVYHALGVRQMLFAYNLNNRAGGGCQDALAESLFSKICWILSVPYQMPTMIDGVATRSQAPSSNLASPA